MLIQLVAVRSLLDADSEYFSGRTEVLDVEVGEVLEHLAGVARSLDHHNQVVNIHAE